MFLTQQFSPKTYELKGRSDFVVANRQLVQPNLNVDRVIE